MRGKIHFLLRFWSDGKGNIRRGKEIVYVIKKNQLNNEKEYIVTPTNKSKDI